MQRLEKSVAVLAGEDSPPRQQEREWERSLVLALALALAQALALALALMLILTSARSIPAVLCGRSHARPKLHSGSEAGAPQTE